MADNIEHLMLEQFRRVREDIQKLAGELRELKTGLVSATHHRLGIELTQQADGDAIETLKKRLDRVERRLQLSEPDPSSPTGLSDDGALYRQPPGSKR